MKNDLTLYRAYIISPVSTTQVDAFSDGALVVDKRGQIIDVGDYAKIKAKNYIFSQTHEFSDYLIIPGFIDLHVHLPQITMTGSWGKNLLSWLNTYIFEAEAKMADLDWSRQITEYFYNQLLKNGTTCAVVFASSQYESTRLAFNIALQRNIRLIMGQVLMDVNAPEKILQPCSKAIDESHKLYEQFHEKNNGLLHYALTPRFAITSTEELLFQTGKLYKSLPGCYLQTHLAESIEETGHVKTQFKGSKSYTNLYLDNDLLGRKSILAHCIYLNDDDCKTIKKTDSKIAHCPSSNFFLKSGKFNYDLVKKHNITFGLGSDIAGGPDINIRSSMKDAYYMQFDHFISPYELFYLGTLAPALALGQENKIGALACGLDADFQVLKYNLPINLYPSLKNLEPGEILSKLIFNKNSFVNDKTFVRGQCLYDLTINETF